MSDRHRPSKLIKNQNASTVNADKLKAKMSETIMSSAPPAFSSEYFGDELGSLSSCRSKYATTISRTPMNPTRSNKWNFMVTAAATARRSESRVPAPHYNHCHELFSTASSGAASDANPLHVGRPSPANRHTRQFHARKADPSFVMSLFVYSLNEHIAFGQVFCLSDTRHEIVIKLGAPVS
jgi:hypothetical protein